MTAPVYLDDYPLRSYDKLRYGDTDRQGHVNNAVFSTFLETGRVEMIHDGKTSLADEGCSFVIARLELNYVSELLWPGRVEIGSGVIAIGRSSIRMEQALFQGERLVALGETVIVQVSDVTRRSQGFSETLKDRAGQFRKEPRRVDGVE